MKSQGPESNTTSSSSNKSHHNPEEHRQKESAHSLGPLKLGGNNRPGISNYPLSYTPYSPAPTTGSSFSLPLPSNPLAGHSRAGSLPPLSSNILSSLSNSPASPSKLV